IAHNKVMVMDSATILTGSFNFTKRAEENNAENLLVIKEAPALVQAYEANIALHAGHSHPYTRATTTPSVTAAADGAVRGNRHSKVYRRTSCTGYAEMSPASIVRFTSEAEAQQAGYRKAKDCP